jgi:c-di-AMP phosphodiesterase-like protein
MLVISIIFLAFLVASIISETLMAVLVGAALMVFPCVIVVFFVIYSMQRQEHEQEQEEQPMSQIIYNIDARRYTEVQGPMYVGPYDFSSFPGENYASQERFFPTEVDSIRLLPPVPPDARR